MDKKAIQESVQLLFTGGATNITVGQTIEAFLHSEMVGLSSHTYRWYKILLEVLAEFLDPHRSLADLMESDLMNWRTAIGERGLSPFTFHGHVRAVKRFFRWLFTRGILTIDLAAHVAYPKLPKLGRKGISEENLQTILKAAENNPRDYALFMFLAATGARRAGIANLMLADLSLEESDPRLRRRATVREKGNKERIVLMTPRTLQALEIWLAKRPAIDDQHVFLGRRRKGPWRPLTPNGVSSILVRYKKSLNLRGSVSPHQWRHRRCRRWLQEGLDLSSVSRLAGHSDPAMTIRFYGGFDIDQLQDAFDKRSQD